MLDGFDRKPPGGKFSELKTFELGQALPFHGITALFQALHELALPQELRETFGTLLNIQPRRTRGMPPSNNLEARRDLTDDPNAPPAR